MIPLRLKGRSGHSTPMMGQLEEGLPEDNEGPASGHGLVIS